MLYSWRVHLNFKDILVVGAHPDDIEYSCLGFLLHQKELGARITAFIASSGSINDNTSGIERIQESHKSLEFNGIEQFYSNVGNFDYVQTEAEIRDLISSNSFDCVLVHDPRDSHQEHRIIYEITFSAIRRLNLSFIRYRSVSTTQEFIGNYRVGIDKFFKQKIETLQFHSSQQSKSYMSVNSIENFHTFYDLSDNSEKFFETFAIQALVDLD
jgi:LmbE family N-acetylglucosaminyl deacetylase